MTLAEYQEKIKSLTFIKPFERCCEDNALLMPTDIEPLEGRNCFDVSRTCIVRCNKCGRKFASQYD